MELTQTNGFGVGVFWRNVILERVMITRSYEQKGHLGGRGERTEVGPFSFDQIKIIVL